MEPPWLYLRTTEEGGARSEQSPAGRSKRSKRWCAHGCLASLQMCPPPPGLGINMMKLGINTSRLVTVPLRRGACIINLVGHDDSLPSWHPSLCPPEP